MAVIKAVWPFIIFLALVAVAFALSGKDWVRWIQL